MAAWRNQFNVLIPKTSEERLGKPTCSEKMMSFSLQHAILGEGGWPDWAAEFDRECCSL